MISTDEATTTGTAARPGGMTPRRRKIALLLGALAIAGMGAVTVSCSSPSEQQDKPTETSVTTPSMSPTEKNVRTNVTRTPGAAAPPAHGNPAVPCGFGPAGGAPCGNNG